MFLFGLSGSIARFLDRRIGRSGRRVEGEAGGNRCGGSNTLPPAGRRLEALAGECQGCCAHGVGINWISAGIILGDCVGV